MRAPSTPLWSMQRAGHLDGEGVEDPWGLPSIPLGGLTIATFRFALREGGGHV
jgi:hypothetical protein